VLHRSSFSVGYACDRTPDCSRNAPNQRARHGAARRRRRPRDRRLRVRLAHRPLRPAACRSHRTPPAAAGYSRGSCAACVWRGSDFAPSQATKHADLQVLYGSDGDFEPASSGVTGRADEKAFGRRSTPECAFPHKPCRFAPHRPHDYAGRPERPTRASGARLGQAGQSLLDQRLGEVLAEGKGVDLTLRRDWTSSRAS
jgi:hypothetical protein